MNKDIFIVGTGQTKFGEWWSKSLKTLIQEAVEAAIASSPCTALDIDMVIVANMLGEVGSDQAQLGSLASSLLPHHPPALRVEAACASGSIAIHTACAFLESGKAQTVLVVGAEKMTDASPDVIASGLMGAADAERDRGAGLTFPGIFGLVASRYMFEYGLTRDDLSLVSAYHHAKAAKNPFAQFRQEISPESVSRSSMIADPLRLLDCSPISDGAAACILSTKETGKIRIAASEIATDALSISKRPSITSFSATKEAAEKAWKSSGISRKDISFLELHDCFSIAAVINLEDLEFAEPGNGISVYRNLLQGKDAPIKVNQSGGLKGCGHPVAATGIKQIIDIGKQLTAHGERFGMTHNFGGAAATCAVHILEHCRA